MCTSINLKTKDNINFLARTMDFSFELDANPVYIPKGYQFKSDVKSGTTITSTYSFVGAGRKLKDYVFADGVNEKGIGCCALYFSDLAVYADHDDTAKMNLAPHEVVFWALSSIGSLDELEEKVSQINIVNEASPFLGFVTPLHWIFSDENGRSIILEVMNNSVHFYEDVTNVFTNSPEYTWHLTNLKHFSYLQTTSRPIGNFGAYKPGSDGAGSGLLGMPGDYTSESRFVRSAFMREHIEETTGTEQGLNAIFHILATCDIPKGVKKHDNGALDYTQYKAAMDLTNRDYYMMDYYDSCPAKISLAELDKKNSPDPIEFQLSKRQTVINLTNQ
ncbi:choloylglycine hydrolase family protein [Vagococcus vulneris]|uniref:Penicillin acylase n=1 Tax=Vagococcus vulneris TaxID=1977869 RepID=A0A430A232_9ENTE|nr:choloylglycine hydrolase family protein [Vagococcus vulneris]RSU00506.1 penicillin acylase [Vagococcus vulneris]